jgi:inner membrane protein
MIQSFIAENAEWSWFILGVVLIGIEIIAPGTFFLWFGLAAISVGLISLVFGEMLDFWSWQLQVGSFALLSVLFVYLGKRMMARYGMGKNERSDLNERANQLVGRKAILVQAIEEGVGRARIGDSTWRVIGPETPKGKEVLVVGADGSTLKVERSD